jgi:hypothetical protein
MPSDIALKTYRLNKEFYDPILKKQDLKDAEKSVQSSALLISGCQDKQLSRDGTFNGLFTAQLLAVWKDGLFVGNYKEFHKEIVTRMPPYQTPNYYVVGQKDMLYESTKAIYNILEFKNRDQ